MSVKYNRIDKALVSTGPTEVIGTGEVGSIDEVQLVVEKTGGGSVTIEGANKPEEGWGWTLTVEVPAEGLYRSRMPLDVPKNIRLAATGAELSIRG